MKNLIFFLFTAVIMTACGSKKTIEQSILDGEAYAEYQLLDLSTGKRFSIPYTGEEPHMFMSYTFGDTVVVQQYYSNAGLFDTIEIYGPNSNAILGNDDRVVLIDSLSAFCYIRCRILHLYTKELTSQTEN